MRLQPRYRIQVVLRMLLIVATSLLLVFLIGRTRHYEMWLIVAVLVAAQIAALVRYGEKTARDVTRFLESVRYSDLSVGFTDGGRGPIFERLKRAFEDVTDAFRRVRAEREDHFRYLQHVVQNVGIALLSFRMDGTVQFINGPAKRLLGISHLGNVHDLAERSDQLTRALLTLQSGYQDLVRLERSGRPLQIQIAVNRFRLHDETFALASLHDIGNELEEREMDAWQQLSRVLTHEIMNSVAPIASLASTADELLKNHGMKPHTQPQAAEIGDVHEAVRVIERRSRALVHFVEAYRSFASIPAPTFEMFRVADVTNRVRRLLNSRIEAGAVTCEIDVEPKDLMLTADPELIEQVLINLLLNSIDAVDGRPGAQITLRAHADERGIPVVHVCDNGPGIHPDVRENLFVPFFTTKENGSGIGLSLSRQIMRLHGGTLTVESKPEEGATFTMRF